MKESDIVCEFARWKKLHSYLNLERGGHVFSEEELDEIYLLLNACLLKNRDKIEDCVREYGIQKVMAHQC